MKYLKKYEEFILESKILDGATFKQLCRQKYGKLYNYSDVVYKGLDAPVRIICNAHGTPFNVTPKGKGCPECKSIDLPNKIIKQQGYDTLTSPEHTHGRFHYVKKPRIIPNLIRRN